MRKLAKTLKWRAAPLATASGPTLLTDAQLDQVAAGGSWL
jgi:hypothetical protein